MRPSAGRVGRRGLAGADWGCFDPLEFRVGHGGGEGVCRLRGVASIGRVRASDAFIQVDLLNHDRVVIDYTRSIMM